MPPKKPAIFLFWALEARIRFVFLDRCFEFAARGVKVDVPPTARPGGVLPDLLGHFSTSLSGNHTYAFLSNVRIACWVVDGWRCQRK